MECGKRGRGKKRRKMGACGKEEGVRMGNGEWGMRDVGWGNGAGKREEGI